MIKHRVAIKRNLRVSLDEETGVVVERTLAPGNRVRMSFKEDEWQEIADWVRTVNLLSNGYKGD